MQLKCSILLPSDYVRVMQLVCLNLLLRVYVEAVQVLKIRNNTDGGGSFSFSVRKEAAGKYGSIKTVRLK